jgi:hypothetical protein
MFRSSVAMVVIRLSTRSGFIVKMINRDQCIARWIPLESLFGTWNKCSTRFLVDLAYSKIPIFHVASLRSRHSCCL